MAFRFFSGLHVFGNGRLHLGRVRRLRTRREPVLWVPPVVALGTAAFV